MVLMKKNTYITPQTVKLKNDSSFLERLTSGLKYGFLTLPEDIVVPLFQGLVIAACIGFFVPPDFIASYVSANAF